jgi:hypothetical protein
MKQLPSFKYGYEFALEQLTTQLHLHIDQLCGHHRNLIGIEATIARNELTTKCWSAAYELHIGEYFRREMLIGSYETGAKCTLPTLFNET